MEKPADYGNISMVGTKVNATRILIREILQRTGWYQWVGFENGWKISAIIWKEVGWIFFLGKPVRNGDYQVGI